MLLLRGLQKRALSASSLPSVEMKMHDAINSALSNILEEDESACVFGEDVAFGGVFRCTSGLREKFGEKRVFNTPLCEQGIAAFACGMAAQGSTALAEIQFADYIFPAFDQIVNEIAKYRYRSGGQFDAGGVVIRAPYGAIGHGGLYHSQSPEAYFCHTPGLQVVVPSTPLAAKGLLVAAARSADPTLYFEPKFLYRDVNTAEDVDESAFEYEIGKAAIWQQGRDVTVVGWGSQMHVLRAACDHARDELGLSCELIDLRSLAPWDADTVAESVSRTGRLVISHEAPHTGGFAAEIAATIQERCFLSLESPIARVCGYDTPFPLVFEALYVPDKWKNFEAIKQSFQF